MLQKLGLRPVALIFTVLGALSVSSLHSAMAEPVRLASGNLYPPFADQRLPQGGLATAIVRAVFARMGQRVDVEHLDWADAMRLTEERRYFGSFPWFKTDDRVRRFYYSDNVVNSRPRLFIHSFQAASIHELRLMNGRSLCVPKDWAVELYLRGMVEKGEITRIDGNDIVDCFRKLYAKEVDAVSVDGRLGRMAADRVDESAWVNSYNFSPTPTPHYLIVSRTDPSGEQRILEFNKMLQQMQDDLSIQDVIKRFYEQFTS